MKKYQTTTKYKKYNKKRAENSAQQRQIFKRYSKQRNKGSSSLASTRRLTARRRGSGLKGYKEVIAPKHFSLINKPIQVIEFIDDIKKYYSKRKKVFVELKHVEKIDYDAIVVLLAILVRFKAAGIKFNGNFPNNEIAKQVLRESKFFSSLDKSFKNLDSYDLGARSSILTHANKCVDAELGHKVIGQATETIWGEKRRSRGVQRVLVELMLNTSNHADLESEGKKHWWLSVNHRVNEKVVSFSFIDFGVGVFKSLDNKKPDSKFFGWFEKLSSKFTVSDSSELLKIIIEGKLHKTVTGKPFRGKGLPGIREVLSRNQISKLCIITNDAYADVSNNTYRKLEKNFSGTFVYWELNSSNRSWHEVN